VARAAPEVATAGSWARFPESLVSWPRSSRHLEGCRIFCAVTAVSHTSIYSRVAKFKPVDTPEVAQNLPGTSLNVTLMAADLTSS
jgi:hypothetical protein